MDMDVDQPDWRLSKVPKVREINEANEINAFLRKLITVA